LLCSRSLALLKEPCCAIRALLCSGNLALLKEPCPAQGALICPNTPSLKYK
jgi:hypothetical protein